MSTVTIEPPHRTPATTPQPSPPFGVNEMRLTGREWLTTIVIVLAVVSFISPVWKRIERFPTASDYRIPYALSKDYWLYQRRLEQLSDHRLIPILGDSVVWGEYVRPDGTLGHFLNQQAGQQRFVNCGVNGLFPLAMEGLVDDFGGALRNRKIIVQCNLLWLTSPRADLSDPKEEPFNHSRLVPQFSRRIPSYKADANERISALLERHVTFFSWISHLQDAYYNQHSIAQWTLEEDGRDPPRYPNAWRNPFAQVMASIPREPRDDPDRGPASPRHKPWNATGAEPTDFDWVDLSRSLQWQAFQRVIEKLQQRGNDVLVIVGPFNEHMIAPEQRPQYERMRDATADWLQNHHATVIVPQTLPSDLYADASHPLTQGYALLARQLHADPAFETWVNR